MQHKGALFTFVREVERQNEVLETLVALEDQDISLRLGAEIRNQLDEIVDELSVASAKAAPRNAIRI